MKMPTAQRKPRHTAPKPHTFAPSREKYERYEHLKTELTATATTSAEHEAACQLAAKLAGI